jgi:hypothetical protein
LTVKSFKGSLIRAIEVNIISTLLSLVGDNAISVFVDEYCSLKAASLSYRVGEGDAVTFLLDDPPEGVTVTVTEQPNPDDPDAPCDAAVVQLQGLDLQIPADAESITLTVEIRAQGTMGSDTAVLLACSDPNEEEVAENADIIACNFAVEGDVVVIDMFIAGELDADVQYRVELPQFGAQFKLFKLRKTSKASGTQLSVLHFPNPGGPTQLQFRIGNLDNLGWQGEPIDFKQRTQSGVPGSPSQGIPDVTVTFTGTP